MHRRNRLALLAVTATTALVVPATAAAADPGPDSVLGPQQAGAAEPGAPRPGGGPRPDATQPDASQPGVSQPGASEPGGSEPGASESGVSQPGVSQPGASEPGSSQPGVSQPGAVPEPRPRAGSTLRAGIVDVAHRGASAYAPENTLAAFRLAKARHADMFELDVQETKDHKLVIMHDTTLARTTNVETVYPDRKPWKVTDFTLAEIEKLDAGSWFAAKYKGERVPTLDNVLSAMRGMGLGMLLELKSPALYPGIEKRVAAALKASPSWLQRDPSERRLVVQSFDWHSVQRFHAVLPTVPTGLLGTPKVADLPKLAKYADQINPTFAGLTASYVTRVHASHMDVLTWTLNKRSDMEKAASLGVDGIITNKPDVLRSVLNASRSQQTQEAKAA